MAVPVGFHPEALAESAAAQRWPRHVRGTRRFVLRRFPFTIIYRAAPTGVEILAVAHGRRRPGYWRNR